MGVAIRVVPGRGRQEIACELHGERERERERESGIINYFLPALGGNSVILLAKPLSMLGACVNTKNKQQENKLINNHINQQSK